MPWALSFADMKNFSVRKGIFQSKRGRFPDLQRAWSEKFLFGLCLWSLSLKPGSAYFYCSIQKVILIIKRWKLDYCSRRIFTKEYISNYHIVMIIEDRFSRFFRIFESKHAYAGENKQLLRLLKVFLDYKEKSMWIFKFKLRILLWKRSSIYIKTVLIEKQNACMLFPGC